MSRIRVVIYDKEEYECGDWPPTDADGFICWFQNKIESIPQQFRDSAKVIVAAVPDYDDSQTERITIYYYREETPEEILERQAKERAIEKQKEIAERATLAKLKAKYGE